MHTRVAARTTVAVMIAMIMPVVTAAAQAYRPAVTMSVTLPDGSTLEGMAEAVDWDGRLVLTTAAGRAELASGDVRHVRPAR